MEPKDRLIFPLDFPDRVRALRFVHLLKEEVGLFKVGLELFLAAGPELLQTLAGLLPKGFFLDLKLHDIPATMQGAIQGIMGGVAFTTVHCDVGRRWLETAVAALGSEVKVLGVTVLTSLDAEDLLALGYDPRYASDPGQLVLLRAKLAKEAGCAGVVCSGREAKAVRQACGPDFLAVCPGIRPEWASVPGDDQKRVVTPYEAIRDGADYVVVGRPIRLAPEPIAAARRVVQEIAEGMES
jgi:orotidine-5'-phosphate decarboxylase